MMHSHTCGGGDRILTVLNTADVNPVVILSHVRSLQVFSRRRWNATFKRSSKR